MGNIKVMKPTRLVSFALVLLTCSAGVNVLQARRIQSLLSHDQDRGAIGAVISQISGYSIDGATRVVPSSGSVPLVLYYFSPSCDWCERNWPNVQALADASQLGTFRVLGVTNARGVRPYLSERSLRIDVLEGLDDDAKAILGLSGTPHTQILSGAGIVTHEWRGAYSPRIHRQIEDLFQMRLPGILQTGLRDRP
jgi:hypothetical protein